MAHSASRVRQITNSDLRVGDVPSRDAPWRDIQVFALSFDAYEHWGSFERCAEIANQRQHGSLTELRTCLFFEQRRSRHFGDKPDGDALSEIGDLLDRIRDKVARGELT